MPGAPDLDELDACSRDGYRYNFDQASRVLEAMDLLREEAVKTRIPEIVSMVDATFKLLVTSYYTIRRYEMTKLPGTD